MSKMNLKGYLFPKKIFLIKWKKFVKFYLLKVHILIN